MMLSQDKINSFMKESSSELHDSMIKGKTSSVEDIRSVLQARKHQHVMSMVDLERVRASHDSKISLKIDELKNVVNLLEETESQEDSQNEEETNTEEDKPEENKPEETNAEEEQQQGESDAEEEQQEESTVDVNRKYICKRLGLMGYKRSEVEVNFDSMPCEQFYTIPDQDKVAIDSITVYQGMQGRIGGIRVELTDENIPAFQTPAFNLDSYNTEYEMKLQGFKVDEISFQSSEDNAWYFEPYGLKITSSDEGQADLDVVQNLQQDWRLKEYEHLYVKLEPNQTLIGVYGVQDYKEDFTRLGLIVKEKNSNYVEN